ncbi:DUF6270 domain-containing protein [Cellulomonas sp.]|uniref:DUF6270 domain-containing protein n=1 Tax=Cellulomonas sp. TaxID=40001 RepID=UPI001AFDB6DE|nr:DUF6270 domain-containing protein [Cellulomonas sp.]MBO9556777.1 hypothetical protein [Cellulomonas sp.]
MSTAGGASPTRVFIYGSCVSRDTFEHLDADSYALLDYVARQSLVSAYATPLAVPPPPGATSTFAARQHHGDQTSSLLPRLLHRAAQVDLLLVDLQDERNGILVSDDHTTTRTPETMAEPGLEAHGGLAVRHVAFGTDEHHTLWSAAAQRFVADLRRLGLLDRTLVLALPWAEHTEDGRPTTPSFGADSARRNDEFARYHDVLRSLGLRLVDLPAQGVRSSVTHRWGDAPFHYAGFVYEHVAARIDAFSRDLRAPEEVAAPRPHGWDSLVDPWVDSLAVKADKIPSAYRIWQSAHRYLQAGDTERAELCVQLNALMHSSAIPAATRLGEGTVFGYGGIGVVIHALADLGKGLTIAPHVTIGGNGKPVRRIGTGAPTVPMIGDYAVLSTGAKVLGGCVVGPFAIVAPNAVVIDDVAPGAIVGGVPARVIGRVDPEQPFRHKAKYLPLRGLDDAAFRALFDETLRSWPISSPDEPA